MNDAVSHWQISDVSDEAREAAANAAQAGGLSLGEWLSRLIEDSAAPNEEKIEGAGERLTSIERAMLRTRANSG